MIFLKEWFLRLRINYFLKKEKGIRNTVSYNKATHIGLLIHVSDLKSAETVNEFVARLTADGKKVSAICFSPLKKNIHFEFPCFYFSWKDADWKGHFEREIIHTFIKTPFDYLYSINIFPILPFDYILKLSQAKCRVGLFREKAPLDLMIRLPENESLSFLTEQMLKYTQQIKSEETL